MLQSKFSSVNKGKNGNKTMLNKKEKVIEEDSFKSDTMSENGVIDKKN
jgi:hypothetical protein